MKVHRLRVVWVLFVCAVVLVLAAVPELRGQAKERLDINDLAKIATDTRAPVRQLESRPGTPLDAPLDPKEYTVGPGDVLSVGVWSSAPIEYQLTVSPEGTLLIPGVGPVEVRDQTLARAKEIIALRVGRRYINAEVSVVLLTPRKITVQVMGHVVNEGIQEATAVERADRVIARAMGFPADKLTPDEYAAQLSSARQGQSVRHIRIHRRDGSSVRVDLPMFAWRGAGAHNPYLREGDVIYVPSRDDADNAIAVFGGTLHVAQFEYVAGDSLSGLIAMALGLPPGADAGHAILTRLTPDALGMDTVRVDARAVAEGRAPDIALRPGDRLVIPRVNDVRKNYRVFVQGEVLRPGDYPVTMRSTRLSEVLRYAGGFTEEANLKGATLIRMGAFKDRLPENVILENLRTRRANISPEDTAYFAIESAIRGRGEMVSVDFHRLFVEHDSTQDVAVYPYDVIDVPPLSRSVYVFGQVLRPGHVPYADAKGVPHYVDLAGGFAENARTGDVVIIKRSTRAWLDPDETSIEDGDMVWIPREVHTPTSVVLGTVVQIAGIVAALATVVLAINAVY